MAEEDDSTDNCHSHLPPALQETVFQAKCLDTGALTPLEVELQVDPGAPEPTGDFNGTGSGCSKDNLGEKATSLNGAVTPLEVQADPGAPDPTGDFTGCGMDSLGEKATSLNSLIEDDQYMELKRCFLMAGKGRRPTPPQLTVCSVALLLQLNRLRCEGGKTFNDVGDWFCRLFPDTCCSTARLKAQVQQCVVKCTKLSFGALSAVLNKCVDIDKIDDVLTSVGINWKTVLNPEKFQTCLDATVTNGVVVSLDMFRSRQKFKSVFLQDWLQRLGKTTSAHCDRKSINRVISDYKHVNRNKSYNPEAFETFMASDFFSTSHRVAKTHGKSQAKTSSNAEMVVELRLETQIHRLQREAQVQQKETEKLQDHVDFLEMSLSGANGTIKHLTSDLASATTENEMMKAEVIRTTKLMETLTVEKKSLRSVITHIKKKKIYKRFLRYKRLHKFDGDKIKQLQQKVVSLGTEASSLQSKNLTLQQRVTSFQKQRSKLKKRLTCLANPLDTVSEGVAVNTDVPNTLQTRTKQGHNQFTDDIRRTMICLQGEGNVAASKCAAVVRIVARHLYKQSLSSKDLPCTQSILNMADEGHVVSKVQAAEAVLESESFTLHTDGTSRDHNKIVGQQITLDNGVAMSLGFRQVAVEDSSTLLEITIELLEELGDIYCEAHEENEKHDIFRMLLKKMNALMSDRASLMKCFNDKMKAFIESEMGEQIVLHFLYCNAHYLLGLSRACETALQRLEKDLTQDSGTPLGRDAESRFKMYHSSETAVSRLIRSASDVLGPRGDEKSGCRTDWQAYCEEEDVKSYMTSFRSNRFNNFFEGAAAIVHHAEEIKTFFSQGFLSHSNLKLQSIEFDVSDPRLLALLCAVGIIYMRVTGPYWKLVNSKVAYADLHRFIQRLTSHIRNWCNDASPLLDPAFPGVFTKPNTEDNEIEGEEMEIEGEDFQMEGQLFQSVLAKSALFPDAVKHALQELAKEMLSVTQRQLADFLEGGKYGDMLSAEVMDTMKSFPLTNMVGENSFGDMDFDIQKRRRCTTHHRTTTHMLKRNKTGDWLEKKTYEEIARILKTARKKANFLRQQHKLQEKVVRLKIRERLIRNEQSKKQQEKKVAIQRQNIIDAVFSCGGPCKTSADVDRLVLSGLGVNAMKSQIRYLKTVLGFGSKTGLKLTGSKEELASLLKRHFQSTLGENTDSNAELPIAPELEVADACHQRSQKRRWDDSDSDSDSTEASASDEASNSGDEEAVAKYAFKAQGQWVSVYYDNTFYVGQVFEVCAADTAKIKFLERTKGRQDYFRFPATDDIVEVESHHVFRWDFDVNAVSSDFRVWSVPAIKVITKDYERIKSNSRL